MSTRKIRELREDNILMCVANIASHGRQADVRVYWEGDILQREAVTPFFPCQTIRTGLQIKDLKEQRTALPLKLHLYEEIECEEVTKKMRYDVRPIPCP